MRTFLAIATLCCTFTVTAAEPKTLSVKANVSTSFGSSCDSLLIEQVDLAKDHIFVAIYSFTHQRIARAFAEAAGRGVKIDLKYDAGQADWIGMKEALKILKKAGIDCQPIKMSKEYSGMHHKFTIIDGRTVLTGSFNYTAAGDRRNYENIVCIQSRSIADAYKKEFDTIKSR